MSSYKYYNHNPKKLHLKDCVCRAISLATGLHYEAVNTLLNITAYEYNCEKLCVCCYQYLLEDILKYPRFDCDFEQTVEEVSKAHPNNKLILRVNSHLTCSTWGTIQDIWDCSQELVDCFWIIK
jgi:hypothetical protein